MAPDQSSTSELAHLIRTRRVVQGMSQARLGAAVDRTATTVRRWERGESLPPDDALDGLADALDLPRDQLVAALVAASPDEPAAVETDAHEIPAAASAAHVAEDDGATREVTTLTNEQSAVRTEAEPEEARFEAAAASADGPAAEVFAWPDAEDTPIPAAPESPPDEASADTPDRVAAAKAEVPMVVIQAAESGTASAAVIDAGAEVDAMVGTDTSTVGSEGQPWIELPTETISSPTGDEAPDDDPDGQDPVPASPPRRPSTATAAAPAAPQQVVIIDKSYIEDRWQRTIYGLRIVLTVVALVVMALVLAWAVLELWDAIGAVLDLFGEAEEPLPGDTVESLHGGVSGGPAA